MKNIFYILSFFLFFVACEQENIRSIDSSSVVVDGYIFVGQGVDSFRVTKSNSYTDQDTTIKILDGLDIVISNDSKNYTLNSINNGYYQNLEAIIDADQIYTLAFEYEGEIISAETYTPSSKKVNASTYEIQLQKIDLSGGGFGGGVRPTRPDPIEISWDNSEGDYYYVVVENMEENPEDVIILPDGGGFRGRRFSFISRPEIIDFYAIQANQELQQFGTHRVIVYRVNPEYVALYDLNGTSSVSITQPPTNINNGLGIFTGVSSDTVFIEVKKL